MKLPRSARLLKSSEFGRVFAEPTVSRDSCFKILARPNDLGTNRLGMAVSKRACKHATGRNRIKRQIRESFRLNASLRPGGAGDRDESAPAAQVVTMDIVVMPSPQATLENNERLRQSLENHWIRIFRRLRERIEQKPNGRNRH